MYGYQQLKITYEYEEMIYFILLLLFFNFTRKNSEVDFDSDLRACFADRAWIRAVDGAVSAVLGPFQLATSRAIILNIPGIKLIRK